MKNMRKKFELIIHELSGSFGDIGTDLPIIIGLLTTGLVEPHAVFILFGVSQILTGIIYRIPMPVQPLKYMAILMMAQNTSAPVLFAGGFMIAVLMILLNFSGMLNRLKNFIPTIVIRGIQFGLALSLIKLSALKFFPQYSPRDLLFACLLFVIGAITLNRKKIPTALILVAISCVYAGLTHFNPQLIQVNFKLPLINFTFKDHLWDGLVLLAIPQLALSLSNSVFATEQMVKDHFPDKAVSLNKIGYTYSMMNFISPFFGGIPICHGAGGIAGHYALGGRTGLSVIFYGLMYLVLGLFFSGTIFEAIKIFPLPLLGVILLFEAYAIYKITYQHVHSKKDLALYVVIACICALVPNGFLWGLILGIIAAKLIKKSEPHNKSHIE
jgi:MFS superfamily sulfate permease-like transporter